MTTEVTAESVGIDDDAELLLTHASRGLEVEIKVGGEDVDPVWALSVKECPHAEVVNIQTLVAFIKDETTDTVIEWQVRVRARCGSCGGTFDIHPNGRAPRDGGHGVVLAMLPTKED